MTVETDLDRAQYATNGTTGPWTVPFYFLAADELAVTYTDASGIDSILLLNVDYTVMGAGNPDGGTITTAQAYAAGGKLVVLRDVNIVQDVEYAEGDGFPAKTHERALDRLTMIAQQLREISRRSLVLPPSSTGGTTLPDAATRANKSLAFDADGNPYVLVPISGSATDVLVQLALGTGGSNVGFQAAGTGAVRRTQLAKSREHVSLEDYGGVADWNGTTGTDNYGAWLKAYAVLPATGGVIELGAGAYYTSQPWVASGIKRVILVGRGGSEAANATGATEIIKAPTINGPCIVLAAAKSEVHNFNVRGRTGNAGDGIQVTANQCSGEDVGSYGMGGNAWRFGSDTANLNANGFHFTRCRGGSSVGHGAFIDDAGAGAGLPNANAGILHNFIAQGNGGDGWRASRAAFSEIRGGTFEGNTGAGGRCTGSSKFILLDGGDYEANSGAAQIVVEAGAFSTKVHVQSLYFESIVDLGTNTSVLMPSSTNAGWFSKGVFRMQMGNPGGPSDIISGAGGGYTRLGYGGDAVGGALTDATAQVVVASNGLHLGKSTSGLVGFFDATPVAKQTTAVGSSSTIANSGTTVNLATTFAGYTLQQVVQALRNYGLLQ